MPKLNIEWKVEKRKVSDLKEWDKNPRKITGDEFEALKKSITKRGYHGVLKIDTEGNIISGNQGKRALVELGIEEINVMVPDRVLTDKEKDIIAVESNLHRGEFDIDILANEFEIEDLEEAGYDTSFLDFKAEDDDFDEDEIDKSSTPVSKRGDIYLLGQHRVMCGDSTSKEDLTLLMAGDMADMVFTDPPYGVKYVGKTKDELTIENDDLNDDDGSLEKFLFDAFNNVLEFLKEGSGVYVAAPAGPLHNTFGTVLKTLKIWRQTITWVKDVFVMGRSDYHYRHEPIFYGWKPGDNHRFYGDRTQDTVWEIDRPKRSTEHPTMKPIELISKAIQMSSLPNELVLDPFLGSGSTLIASEETERICYGMELDPVYVDVIIKRWEKLTGEKAQLVGN
jgi:DNA modification methylase